MEIDWSAIDKKWQKKWLENNDHEIDSNDKEKKFITVAYPYPNSPQHIGHGRTYTIADVHSRYLRMKGFNVLFPMGFHYTGTPILGMAKRVEANDVELIEGFKTLYNVPEDKIKEETGADLRVIPSDSPKAETCIYCKNSGTANVLFARGY